MKISPRDNKYRTQEQAIEFHNSRKERMLSMPDIFQLVKDNNTETIESLRKDFEDRWLVTSTRIIYDSNNLSATIIHNAGSTVIKPTEISLNEIPVCQPTYLKELIGTEAGLSYIRALINNSKAAKEQITEFMVNISGKKEKNIRFWTPSQSSRADKQVRSVGLSFDGFDRFIVDGDNWIDDDDGLSRGVIIDSAKQTIFFSKKAIFDLEEKIITIPLTTKLRRELEKKQKKGKIKIYWKLNVSIK